MQRGPADAEWVLERLARAGAVAVERDREVVYAYASHAWVPVSSGVCRVTQETDLPAGLEPVKRLPLNYGQYGSIRQRRRYGRRPGAYGSESRAEVAA